MSEKLAACFQEAVAVVAAAASDKVASEGACDAAEPPGLRCLVCGEVDCGHMNCVERPPPPPREEFEAEEPEELEEEDAEVINLYASWGEPGSGCNRSVQESDNGEIAASSVELALLQRLARAASDEEAVDCEDLAALPASAIEGASQALVQLGAVLPSLKAGVPQLSAKGWWLSQLQVPPAAAAALLHGALCSVLLPVAALVVLLEKVPPDLAFLDGSEPPRRSGHFALASTYFRWREGRETKLSKNFASRSFWEAVDQRIVAICKHAQQALRYDGDDAAFDEMDGELMDVRRRDGRPWTCASAFGSESSRRWAQFLAALSAAWGPRPGAKSGEWVISTGASHGQLPLDTVVSPGHAMLFSPGELSFVSGTPCHVKVCGVRGTLCGGEGAFEEADALRQELSERSEQALGGGDGKPIAEGLEESLISQALDFLRSSASELVPVQGDPWTPDLAHSRIVTTAVLAMMDQQPRESAVQADGASHVGTDTSLERADGASHVGTVGTDTSSGLTEDDDGFATALAHASLLQILKHRAVKAEEYDLAAKLKSFEAGTEAALVASRRSFAEKVHAEDRAVLERLVAKKRKAVELEDYELASQLKQQEQELMAKTRQETAEVEDGPALSQAAKLASNPAWRAAQADQCRAGANWWLSGADVAVWAEVEVELRKRAKHCPGTTK